MALKVWEWLRLYVVARSADEVVEVLEGYFAGPLADQVGGRLCREYAERIDLLSFLKLVAPDERIEVRLRAAVSRARSTSLNPKMAPIARAINCLHSAFLGDSDGDNDCDLVFIAEGSAKTWAELSQVAGVLVDLDS